MTGPDSKIEVDAAVAEDRRLDWQRPAVQRLEAGEAETGNFRTSDGTFSHS